MDRRFFCGAPQAGEPFAVLCAHLTNDHCDALAVMTTGWTRRLEAVLYRADEAAASAEALHTVSLLLIVVLAATNMLTLPLLALLGLVGACGIVTYSVTTPALVPALVKAEEYSWAQRADRIGSHRGHCGRTRLPDGSFRSSCDPPGPVTMSVRNSAPAARSRPTFSRFGASCLFDISYFAPADGIP